MKNTKKVRSIIAFGLVVAIATLAVPWTVRAECPPPECQTGVRSSGYWMNHPEAWPEWAKEHGIRISSEPDAPVYTQQRAIALMKAPTKGDKRLILFQAYIAARLNVTLENNCTECVEWALNAAKFYLYWYRLPVDNEAPQGEKFSNELWGQCVEPVYWELDAYNNGQLCTPAQE
jgi:hypothetical protein